ncbi:hypothetical protein N7468_005965 [Penicillium chermesinum]|uniref:Uncharacterized protein n=1 Tax=Penicillium chermesinum TaxID=63820 RepID=A0A9W9P0A8_9EURO|nr:uncharacterized protein N7468_005965 [Penicillium chermesinum]KAJ5233009.1 hypothetical protein N7468_005965 [Penicillium chermesinum]KAJ6172654.1 hypothetical protein N7470_001721 [Penicillium chermesinum]
MGHDDVDNSVMAANRRARKDGGIWIPHNLLCAFSGSRSSKEELSPGWVETAGAEGSIAEGSSMVDAVDSSMPGLYGVDSILVPGNMTLYHCLPRTPQRFGHEIVILYPTTPSAF